MHKTSPHRNQRLADQIQRDLAELIPRELRSPSLGLITLQSIELTPDLAHAKVFFTVLGAEPEHCLLYTSPSPRDRQKSRMPSSA